MCVIVFEMANSDGLPFHIKPPNIKAACGYLLLNCCTHMLMHTVQRHPEKVSPN